ncbi:MAG: XTP/dITP diphosphatase [Thermicanus sp.]|nr:XTP/dITP diphosphatase [Thermicanus sp.]
MNSLPLKIVLATRNPHKGEELTALLSPYGIEVVTLASFPGAPEVVEDGKTFEENARKKAVQISSYTHLPTLADDSGLAVEALGGNPGVYSARYAGEKATDEENNRKLLKEMAAVPQGMRQASFVSVIAYAEPEGEVNLFRGVIDGEILFEPRGAYGFGYDPLFYIPSLGKSMAELSPEEKNRISHRAKAHRNFIDFFVERTKVRRSSP